MSVLYVKEQGALIQKRSERLLITRNNQSLLEIPIYNIDSIAVIGNVQITSQALQTLMKNGIDVRYFAFSGKYLGCTSSCMSRNIFRRLSQYQLYADMDRRMALARRIIVSKIENQMEVIRAFRWEPAEKPMDEEESVGVSSEKSGSGDGRSKSQSEEPLPEETNRREASDRDRSPVESNGMSPNIAGHSGTTDRKAALAELERLTERAAAAQTSNELMGIEGRASSVYFHVYGAMFHGDDFARFRGRNRRPPRDPVNAIISLGYTFLTNEVSAALEAESFEMYMGFLHGIRYGRKSLPLDMVEEFRQPVVDRMTLRLFNKRMLQEFDFTEEDGAVMLTEDGFKKFCREFERWMSDPACVGDGPCYRSLIRGQAARLGRAVQHGEEYEPYCLSGRAFTL